MRVAALLSGGKDSVFSTYWAIQQGWDVCVLVSVMSKNPASFMFHTPNIEWTALQAKALGIPHLIQRTDGRKEHELGDLRKALAAAKRRYGATGVMVGAIASDYQQERVNRVCEDLGLATFAPLWHKRQETLLQEMIDCGFDIIIQSIAADGLDKRWLGRRIDQKCLDDLMRLHKRIGLHVAGEGGEYESFVLDGPIFRKRIVLEKVDSVMEGECIGYLKVFKAALAEKKSPPPSPLTA